VAVPSGPASSQADLDPSYLREHTYATRRRHELIDLSALVSLMIVTLFLLPSALSLSPLSTAGRPALLFGLVLSLIWLIAKVHPLISMRGPQPLRWAVALWLVTLLLSYAAGQGRGLTPLEASSSDLAMIYFVVFCGIVLACADGIPSRQRLGQLVRVLVWSAAGMAVIGLLQALLDVDLTRYMHIPGLDLQHDPIGVQQRAGFERIASTTGHYIEFSAVMAIALPFAIHLARFGDVRLVRQLAVVAGVLIAAVIPLTLSRTGLLAILVMIAVMTPVWPWPTRFNLLVAAGGLFALATVARPGLIGTIRSLFTGWDSDDSIQGRTDRYETVLAYFQERPLLGRGPGTFVPDLYLILDNQWLGLLVSGGLIGVIGLLALHLTAIVLAVQVIRRAPQARDRHLAACLLTTQLVAIIAAGTFDSFAFTTFATSVAICAGFTGALWRLSHPVREVRTAGARLGRDVTAGT
jgi:polysaccharide biosynthesis protein PslJ